MDDHKYPAFATVDGWKGISGDSRSTIYEKLGDGRLRGVKDGRRTKIDVAYGLAHLRALPPAQIRQAKKK